MFSPHLRFAVAVALLASACSGERALERFTPPDVDARSREYINQFTRGQIDSAMSRLVAPLRSAEGAAELRKLADILRNEHFDSVRVVGAQLNTIGGVRHVNLTYELHSPFSWFLANVATVDTAGTWFVEGVSARTIAQPLEVAAQFSLRGKSFLDYSWLVVTVLCAALSLGAALFLATRRSMPKRWRWVLLSLVGVGAFRLNWATGATDVALLQLQLASASLLSAAPTAAWIVSFGLPVGALIGLGRYRRWRSTIVQAPADKFSASPVEASTGDADASHRSRE